MNIAAEMKGIKKYFGSVKANDGVDLSINYGEIQAILGENGSGKSTAMNVLSGLYAPDEGSILIGGKAVNLTSPRIAMDHGIDMIHQHLKLVDAITAWENIIGGTGHGIFLRKADTIRKINGLCDKYGFQLDPEKEINEMTIGEKQTVEIVKALFRGAKILILDEPTAVLTVQETDRLFQILREMKADGCAVLIITHKLNEVMNISDRVTIFRKGVSVKTIETSKTDAAELASLMVGHEVDISVPYEMVDNSLRKPVMVLRNVSILDENKKKALDVEDLTIRSYEIFGIAGIVGSGQRELCDAITGMCPAQGSIRYNDREIIGMNPETMQKAGIRIAYIPEDRLGMGLAANLSISDNVALRTYKKTKGIMRQAKEEKAQAEKLIEEYSVSALGVDQVIRNLSGGNIQKILLGREIEQDSKVLIAAYPVRGLDIGASNYIYEKLNEEKKKGTAILLIGEDLDVLLSICDRIAVLHQGRIMDVLDAKKTTKEELGLLMIGHRTGRAQDVQN